MIIRVDDTPDDYQVLLLQLFEEHNLEVPESLEYRIVCPYSFPTITPDMLDIERGQEYAMLMVDAPWPVLRSRGKLVDGWHRLFRAQQVNKKVLLTELDSYFN